MIPTIYTTLALGVHVLSQAGQAFLAAILIASTWVPGSQILTGHQFLIPDDNTTTANAVYLKDETTPIKTWPLNVPDGNGEEYCEGFTGALLCTVAIKLTGSGGHKAHNAGSYLCSTTTCSIVDSRVFTEAVPLSDHLYGGWTTAPNSSSGAQLFNKVLAASGATLIGSGSYVAGGLTAPNVEKDVPPGATIKFTWHTGNSSEDFSRTKALAVIRFWKYYTP